MRRVSVDCSHLLGSHFGWLFAVELSGLGFLTADLNLDAKVREGRLVSILAFSLLRLHGVSEVRMDHGIDGVVQI